MRNIILSCLAMTFAHFVSAQIQIGVKEVRKTGNLTVDIYREDVEINEEGTVIRKTVEETNYTVQQKLVLHPDKYKMLKNSSKQLQAYSNANASFVLSDDKEIGKTAPSDPIKYYHTRKEWAICNDENLRLVYDELSSGILEKHHSGISIKLYPGDSKEKMLDDEMLTRAMDEFERQRMAKKREDDLRAGKVIKEEEYFVPASLPSAAPFHVYFFTMAGPRAENTLTKNFGVEGQSKSYDCEFDKWRVPEVVYARLYSNISAEMTVEKNANKRYRTVGIQEIDNLMSNSKTGATLVGGVTEYVPSPMGYTKELRVYTLRID
ncbi:hypothetical protein [Sphingobacterium faecale]|uniref:DUF4412 domain-containing protein n=1 Tax=Sphingobacterium faecale TaxID=2803775 RepID=A0ABS1R2B7_9SPHI|nr:hypothetical protein [Sphingobacterium faecale]MBL1408445.1 hypothetical protein [Sphingobacterium faecale]